MSGRIVAIDWSGAKSGASKKIAFAEARDGVLLRLEGGRDRDQIVQHLIGLTRTGEQIVVGLDFGFSFPAWYLREQGFAAAAEAWRWLASDGCADRMLAACERPYWGARGRPAHTDVDGYRRTERAVEVAEGVRPKSVFQIGGAGSVGTGSLRGMCALRALREGGFAIWPFDHADRAAALEIYPRLFSRGVVKTDPSARRAHLDQLGPRVPATLRDIAASTDDAFDAATTAIAISQHADDLAALPPIEDPTLRLEGIIWWPNWRAAHGC